MGYELATVIRSNASCEIVAFMIRNKVLSASGDSMREHPTDIFRRRVGTNVRKKSEQRVRASPACPNCKSRSVRDEKEITGVEGERQMEGAMSFGRFVERTVRKGSADTLFIVSNDRAVDVCTVSLRK